MSTATRKAIIVGISGCSSSGKTTLSRLLRDIFPNTYVLHEDDFYRPEEEIYFYIRADHHRLPKRNDLLDWDCAESLSLPDMIRSLEHIREHGAFPPDLDSKEDLNSVGPTSISNSCISHLKDLVSSWTSPGQPGSFLHSPPSCSSPPLKIFILDGFLLYSPSVSSLLPHLDLKFFLRASYAKAKARREARSGYVTLEGFWEDPPGYVDQIVWPNYVNDHAWMFEKGDVEGEVRWEEVRKQDIEIRKGGPDEGSLEERLVWIVERLMERLPEVVSSLKE